MSASLAVEHLLQINSRQQRSSKARNTTQNDEASSRTTPRRTRSRTERNKEIKRQLNESALAQMQLSLDAQGASAAAIPPRSPLKKERRNKSRSKSPGHKKRGKCKSTTTGKQQAPFTNGHPDSYFTPSIRAPRRSLSQPMTLKHMQTSLDSITKPSKDDGDLFDDFRPPRSPTKLPMSRHIQSSSPVSVASSIEGEFCTDTSPTSTRDTISSVPALQSLPPGYQPDVNDQRIQQRESRDERRERRLLRRNRSASLTSPKRPRSMSSRRTKNVQEIGKFAQGSDHNVSVNAVGNCAQSVESPSITFGQQEQSSNQSEKTVSYPSPKEEPAKKGDSPPAPPRKAVQPDGHLRNLNDASSSSLSAVTSDEGESDAMDTSIPVGLSRAESDSLSSTSNATAGLVVSTSTRRTNRPTRTSSVACHGAAPLPRPGPTRRRSRQPQRNASESSDRLAADVEKTGLTEKEEETPITQSSAVATEQSTSTPVSGQDQPQGQLPAMDPRPPKAPQSRSRKEKGADNRHSRAQRGRNFISGLKDSFSFSNRNIRRAKSATRSDQAKTKDTRRTIALSSFLKNPAPDSPLSPANTERTGHTASTMSSEQSDLSFSNRSTESPPRVYDPHLLRIRPLNLARLRVEFDKPRGVDRDEDDGAISPAMDTRGLEIDTHILVAAAASADVDSDPDSILAAHFAKLNKNATSLGKDITEDDEASDIESMESESSANKFSLTPPRRSRSYSPAPTRRHKSRSRSRSKKGRRHKRKIKTSVSFDKVYIREYERGLGDSPAVSSGPPIGLGWTYLEATEVPVEHYETSVRAPAPRRRKDFFLSPQRRFHILLDEWGCTLQDICRAKDEAAEIRCQRQISVFGNANVTQQVQNKAAVAVAAAAAAAEKKKKKSKTSESKNARSRSKSLSPPVPLETPVPRRGQWNPPCSPSHIPPAPLELSA